MLQLHRRSDDPVLAYDLQPGAVVQREDGIVYHVNAQGFRHQNDVEPRHPGKRRIEILGDSVAFGMDLNEDQTFAHLLEDELSRDGQPMQVLNLSVLGYKTAQEVRRFERDGLRLEPDGVVLAFCLNDFDDYSAALPLLDPSIRLPVEGVRRQPPRRLGPFALPDDVPILDRSLVFRGLTDRLLRPDYDYYLWVGTDPVHRAEVSSALQELGHALAARKIPGLIVIFPLLVKGPVYPYAELPRFVAEQGRAAGLAVVDLRDGWRDASLVSYRLRANDAVHLNAVGHAATARALAPCLADHDPRCPGDQSAGARLAEAH